MNTLLAIKDFVVRNKIACICSFSELVLVIVLFCAFSTRTIDAYAKSKTWQRDIVVQKYDWVHKDHTSEIMYPSIPNGARNTNSYMTMHTHGRYNTTYTGSGENRRSHTSYYNVIDHTYHVSYDSLEWTYSRTVTLKGDASKKVEWPVVVCGTQS